MRSVKIILILILLLPNLSWASLKGAFRRQDLFLRELKGKVKVLKEISYETVRKNGKLIKGRRKTYQNLANDICMFFNRDGHLIENREFNSAGDLENKEIYEYNKTGDMINFTRNYLDETTKEKLIFEYDKIHNLIIEKYYAMSGKLKGRMHTEMTYKYDNKGYLIEQIMSGPGGHGFFKKSFYVYDNKGNLIEMKEYEYVFKTLCKTTYEYDRHGNLKKEIYYNSKGKLEDEFTYEYLRFDNKGNWTKRILYINGIPRFIIEREIKYYD